MLQTVVKITYTIFQRERKMNNLQLSIFKTMDVLIAEDDEIEGLFLANTLRDYFANVYVVKNGKEALEFLKNKEVDLLITDLAMPYVSGIKLIDTIRQSEQVPMRKQLPVIVLSARQDTKELLEIARLKLVDYVLKPISLSKILETLHRLYVEIKTKNSFLYSLDEKLMYDPFTKTLHTETNTTLLSHMEASLLEVLIQNKGRLLPKSILMEAIYNQEVEDVTFRNLLVRLRKKVGKERLISVKELGIKLI